MNALKLQELANILTDIDKEEAQTIGRPEETRQYTAEDLQNIETAQNIIEWLVNMLY